ncbi:DUF2953 domain-containing protein [Cohnella abietis]|uniref:DUF2953 domain-containing protein n=1 Tax=Cohnella abietis TaxID=2507935 RepID=A0A3T1D4W7_9BACL|nr:DUF2953 domain-containing protein [Cohnella abietis]BBI33150.1 hypothetical protein KCTCHS21_25490 [Cohnella abietis]
MAFWHWIILAVICVGVVGALFSPIRIRVRYSRSGQLDQLVIVIRALYGLYHYQILLPSIVIKGWNVIYRERRAGGLTGNSKRKPTRRKIGKGTVVRYMRAYRALLQSTKNFKIWARHSLKKLECTRWRLDFRVGTGDAASTAVITGLLWAVSGCASGVAGQLVRLNTSPQGQITPNYSGVEFTVVWEADFRIRLGTLLWIIAKLGKDTIRVGKAIRAWRHWLTGPKEA